MSVSLFSIHCFVPEKVGEDPEKAEEQSASTVYVSLWSRDELMNAFRFYAFIQRIRKEEGTR
jgi:hypothetical protein